MTEVREGSSQFRSSDPFGFLNRRCRPFEDRSTSSFARLSLFSAFSVSLSSPSSYCPSSNLLTSYSTCFGKVKVE